MKDSRDAIDFAKDPVKDVFRKMFFPTLIGMLSMVVLNITDGAFVGHGVGSDGLAAVNIVAPLFLIASGVGLLFGIGASVVASIHLSKGNIHAANLNITQGVIASYVVGGIIGLLVFFFQEETCKMFGCSDALVPLACSYIRWIALMTPFNMVGMTGMFAVRLDGHPRFAMVMNCSMAFANIVLDWVLIYPCHMGLEGAAIATCTAFGLGNIPLLWFLFTQTRTVHLCRIKLTRTSLALTVRNLLYQMKIGASGFIGEAAIACIMIVGNYVFIHWLGEDGVAAYSVGCYCLPIVFMLGNAIVQSIQPVISFAYGQNNMVRLRETRRVAITASLICGIIGLAVIGLGTDIITSVFLPSGCGAYVICSEGLPFFSFAFLFIAINIVIIGYLQSIEAVKRATIYTILRGFVFSITAFIFLPILVGKDGLWLALPVAEALTLLVIFVEYLVMKK